MNLRLEGENIIKDIRNLFRVRKGTKLNCNYRPYLKDIINNLKNSDMQKIKLTTANNLICLIDNDEESVMHSKSQNIEIMISDEADGVIK